MENYYKIHELAGLYGISTDALRLYQKAGLITPAYTDPSTGYRYYGIPEILRLDYILQLKGLNFSLAEIKKALSNRLSVEEKRGMLLKEFNRIKELLGRFESFLAEPDGSVKKYVRPRHFVIWETAKVKKWEEILGYFVGLTEKMIKNKLKTILSASAYAVYEGEFQLENFSCEVRLEVAPSRCPLIKEIPAETFISVTHKGSYETLKSAYDRIYDYAEANKLTLKNYAVERYVVAYDNSPLSSDFITEVEIPVD
jgi:Predicted transcriptional regulators